MKYVRPPIEEQQEPGCDGITAKLLKNSRPDSVHDMVAEIYNETNGTGDGPVKLILGKLNAIQKLCEKNGLNSNLKPITLLYMLRKIIAKCMKLRMIDRLNEKIPSTQAAYRQ